MNWKKTLCIMCIIFVTVGISACGNTNEPSSNRMQEPEIFELADNLMREGRTVFWWYHSDQSNELGIDNDADLIEIDGLQLEKTKFQTMAELKAATEAVFTLDFCETHFYDKINENKKFIEIDGVLYHNQFTGGMGWGVGLPKEYIVKSADKNKIILTAICDGLDPDSTSGGTAEYEYELTLLNDGTGWKLNNYYSFTTEGYMGDLLLRDGLNVYGAEIQNIANALFGAGMLGHTWTEPWNDESVYDLSFVTFYCMMNPDYTSEIPASDFELFVHGFFDVSTDNIRQITDYNAEKEVYEVSPDISVSMIQSQINDFFRIGSIVQENGKINVSYRILWGKMAATGDGSDTAYAGIISLSRAGRFFPIDSVNVTEDYSDKYD